MTQDEIDRATSAFRAELRMPFQQDTRLSDALAVQAGPALEALAFAIRAGVSAGDALELREGLSLCALLGRHGALRGLTPSGALVLVEALVAALRSMGLEVAPELHASSRSVVLEGYCATIAVGLRDEVARRAAASLGVHRIAPGCSLLAIGSGHVAETLRDALDRIGRRLLDAGACACVVVVSGDALENEEVVLEILGFDATARMIGVRAIFVGLELDRHPEIRFGGEVQRASSLEEGMASALAHADLELKAVSPAWTRIRRFFG